MDKFVKGENEMWKMPVKKCIQTRTVTASEVKRVLDLHSVCPATHLKMFRQKRNTHKLLRRNHPYCRNVAKHLWREHQIIKFENSIFYSIKYFPYLDQHRLNLWTHTFCNVVIQVALLCASYRLQFIISTSLCCYSFQTEFNKKKWFPTASGVLLLVSRIIYLNKCNRLDIITFRL